ncbi:unnamed protein product [Vitrella brassicaformis CCMP3155]|uniref:Trimethylguanosine synthase n=1 Tax=Vitrella brassicaformis (strain CCMP3155) TaxID=1169540 RepID=A0A0G4G6F2_VITBC|nr:unnamed protein product [Vitrella brassicaformis CCMP3155]|eukprot:CEM23925.1 unnamed protein product [Vitrella brassicaformis CCMP3155]
MSTIDNGDVPPSLRNAALAYLDEEYYLSGLHTRSVPAKSTPTHVDDAQENFKLYGVTPARICKESFYSFVDRTKQRKHRCDLVFADLPWGGAAFVRGSGPSTSPRWATRSVFDVLADCEAITDSFAFKLLRNTPLQAAAELGAWKATRELYENGHELITYTPPVIEAMVTRLPAARRGRTNYKLKYITAYIGNIAERMAKKLPPSRTTTWCPPAHTTVDDRVMHIVNSRATTRTERLQLRFNR